MKRVLMIAYHFPPIQGSSGVHRTVQFARHLPSFGWTPIVVSVHPRAYPSTGEVSWAKLPEQSVIKRAFAIDSARHLSVKGRYLGVTAIPDRWISWWPGGVWECLRLIREYKPDVLWSTFPIATAHLIGLTVNRLTGLPWVADFRDPMVQQGLPADRFNRKAYQILEKNIVRYASCCTLVTQSALENYSRRYPEKASTSWQVIENGYDESLFKPYAHLLNRTLDRNDDKPIKILHSGILYSSGRDPLPFLKAVKSLIEKQQIKVDVTFRGSGNELKIEKQISQLGLTDFVKLKSSISYEKAIKEMILSDVLVLFQGSVFNSQIPAKVYEYIRVGHPILALTDEYGETAHLLKKWDSIYFGDMTSSSSIKKALLQLVNDIQIKKKTVRNPTAVKALSREACTLKLSKILNILVRKG